MTRSEAGKIGAKISVEIRRLKILKSREDYGRAPKKCLFCGLSIIFEKRLQYRFCNHRCAAAFNNEKKAKTCDFCSSAFHQGWTKTKFCSRACMFAAHDACLFLKFEAGLLKNPSQLRRLLLKKRGHKCEMCGGTVWRTCKIPLDVDHINGNAQDCRPENVRLLCKNCHAITPTYGSKNRGNGRPERRAYYAKHFRASTSSEDLSSVNLNGSGQH